MKGRVDWDRIGIDRVGDTPLLSTLLPLFPPESWPHITEVPSSLDERLLRECHDLDPYCNCHLKKLCQWVQ